MSRIEEKTRAGYGAYYAFTGGKAHNGKPMPAWEDLPERIREAWITAAVQIIIEHERGTK